MHSIAEPFAKLLCDVTLRRI